jgi:fragile X mental retardation protein
MDVGPKEKWWFFDSQPFFLLSVLKDPDSNPYSLLDTSEPEPPVDSEPGEPPPASARRRRSRRRRTDEDRTVMDGGLESDGPNMTENGLGERHA